MAAPSTRLQFPNCMKRQNASINQSLPSVDELQTHLSTLQITSSPTQSSTSALSSTEHFSNTSSSCDTHSFSHGSSNEPSLPTSQPMSNFQASRANDHGLLISRIQNTHVGHMPQASVQAPTNVSFGNSTFNTANSEVDQHNVVQSTSSFHTNTLQPSGSVPASTNDQIHCVRIGSGDCNPSTAFDNASMSDDVDEDFEREHMSELSFMMSNFCQVDQKASNTRSGFMPYIY